MSGTRSGASRRWRATPSRRSCSCSGSPTATTASSPAQLLPHEGRQLGLGRGAHHPRGDPGAIQWVNGSFCEDIEVQETRPPGDVDVVTLARLGDQLVLSRKLPPEVLDHDLCKVTFHVDHYFVATDVPFSMDQGSMISYWSSLWSHRRADNRWKGFVAIPLASNDGEALAWLRQDIGAPQCGGGSP